jgi:Ca-activated chloride channel homolog
MRIFLLFTLSLLPGVPLRAQEEQPRVPTFRGEVNAVLVDVVVLDRDGSPVSGLTRDDFEVLEDGTPQSIATFDVTDWTSYVGARTGDTVQPTERQANTYPRRFVFIVNRQGARFEYLNRAKRALQTFIVESMAEGDEAMVIDVGYSLKIAQQFRASKEDTLATVKKLSQMEIDYPMGPDRAAGTFYQDLESLGNALAELPGRKVIVVLSNELLTFAGPGSRQSDQGFALKEAIESLNQSNSTVYTIDLRGSDAQGDSITGGLSPLATETGGRFFRNNPSFEPPLRTIGKENQRYYLLSYVSTNAAADGSYRKIDVRVHRSDVQILARPGYVARPPSTKTTESTGKKDSGPAKPDDAAPARGAATGGDELPLAVELTTYLLPTGKGSVRVPVSVALPEDLLTGKGGSDRKLVVTVTDAAGNVVQTFDAPVSVAHFRVLRDVVLDPGLYLLKLVVTSEQQELYQASTGVDIPAGYGDHFGVSSILPVRSPEASKEIGREDLPILPEAAVKRGAPLHLLFLVFPGRDEKTEEVRISYRLLDASGTEVRAAAPGSTLSLRQPQGQTASTPAILSVPTDGLDYGRYRVEIRAEDPSTGRRAASEIEFRVR